MCRARRQRCFFQPKRAPLKGSVENFDTARSNPAPTFTSVELKVSVTIPTLTIKCIAICDAPHRPNRSALNNPTSAFANFANSRRDCDFVRRESERFEGLTNWRLHCNDQAERLLRREDKTKRSKPMDRMLVVVFDAEPKAYEGK